MRMKEKVAVITGGAGGIGLETARMFLKEGAEGILLTDLDDARLKDAAKQLESDRVAYFAADVSKNSDVEAYSKKAIERFGRIDVLFLNAGIEGVVKPLTEYPEDVYDKVMAVNAKSVWLGMKHVFPHMKENGGGSVIITSSVAGMQGTPNVMAYVTSKHAVIGSMKVGALEGAEHNIRVNSIHPSPVDNRMMRSLEEGFSPGGAEEAKKGFEAMIPLGRYAKNDEIASLALFLASDESKFITGATYAIDGGLTT
ncbi:SDR family oxidoreductase [Rhodohalobacter sp. SW132]|uniref:SDR family NAD(P)-dependent oxidoreductase n=1 Tax=Rhodohalobacter sp. SW132 TaxID=2293433 RepID=UPI000E26AED9|nr:SDR family oxidoreductase [Rhodohalobacter sp. SW132]REL25062.1 SDR family oxidoreductase [Rhodohalobacter sp. SW132]